MSHPHWIDSVHHELCRRHLPAPYITRLLGELADHAEDLQLHATDLSAPLEQSLGHPREVAQAALIQYRQTHFAGRHPILIFILLPLPLSVLAFACMLLAVSLISESWPSTFAHSTLLRQTLSFACVLVPILLPAAFLCRIAHQAAISLIWRITACSLLSAFAVCIYSRIEPPSATNQGLFVVGQALPQTLLQWLHLCIPLALFAWSYRRSVHAHPATFAAA